MDQGPSSTDVHVTVRLDRRLLTGRSKLGKKVQEEFSSSPEIRAQLRDDGSTAVPRILLAVEAVDPEISEYRTITWQVSNSGGSSQAPHLLVPFTPAEFVSAVDGDGLSALLHTLEEEFPTSRLHILTYQAETKCGPPGGGSSEPAAGAAGAAGTPAAAALAAVGGSNTQHAQQQERAAAVEARRERLWEAVADLAVWRPDVAFQNAASLEEAATHVYRVTRAVGESPYKQTGVSSYQSTLLQSKASKLSKLEKLLAAYSTPRTGPAATLMRALLAVDGVSAEAAYVTALHFGSMQRLIEAAERDRAGAAEAIAGLPLPASNIVVGRQAAEKALAALAPRHRTG